jgi:hypothetical protein
LTLGARGGGCFAPQISGWNDSDGEPLALVFAQVHDAGLEAWQTRTRREDSDSVNPGSNPDPPAAKPLDTAAPALRALVRSYEYEAWPRGRIVFDRARDLFVLYADRKLLTPATIARIATQFHLPKERTEVQGDPISH